jgi:hypothetical protein
MPRTVRPVTLVLTLTLLLGACGDDDDAAEPPTTAAPADTAPGDTAPGDTAPGDTAPATSTGVDPAPTTTAAPAGPDADVVLEVVVEGGSILEGGGREPVPLGSTVALVVTSDEDEEVHLHGYDVEVPVPAGVPAVLQFTADIPGVFEVELHGSGLGLWDLEIS